MKNITTLKHKLENATETIIQIQDNAIINSIVEKIIIEITNAEYCSIWIHDSLALTRTREDEIKTISMERKEGLLYKCFATKLASIHNHISSDKGYVPEIDNPDGIKIKSKIMIPLMDNGDFIGIVTAYSSIKRIKNFTNDDLIIFKAIAPFIIDSIMQIHKNTRTDLQKEIKLDVFEDKSDTKRENYQENLESLKSTHAEIRDVQEMIDFTSNIVHDIRTPANGLLGFLEILEEQIKDSQLKEYIGYAKESASLITDLTTSIIDGMSTKRALINDAKEQVNTTSFFANIAEIFSANMYKKHINYNIFIDPFLPKEIKIETIKMKRIVTNLISNASKFTPEYGSIEFSVEYKKEEKKLHIFVKDDGIGIIKEQQQKILEASSKANLNTQNLYDGVGLGLSICASHIKELGGKLLVDSELDKGSTFYFDIEIEVVNESVLIKTVEDKSKQVAILLNKQNSFVTNHIAKCLVKIGINIDNIHVVTHIEQISKDIKNIIAFENQINKELFSFTQENEQKLLIVEENFLSLRVNDLKGAKLISQYSYYGESLYSFVCSCNIPRVLIVEDDLVSLSLLKIMLEDEYCEIDTAKNGQEGLQLLRDGLDKQKPYDIIYADQQMPYLTGSEMLKRYSAEERQKTTHKMITVSVSGESKEANNSYIYDSYAIKPFKKREILSIFDASK